MKKILLTLLLMFTAVSILCTFMGCREEDTDLPPSLDTTDSTLPDTTDDTPSDTTAKTTETPDTEPQQPEDKIWEDLGMTEQEWNDFATEHADYFPEYIHETVMAMLTGDVDTFAKNLGAPTEVYEYIKAMEFGSYKLYTADVPARDAPTQTRKYPVFEVEVKESSNSFFPVGTNRIVFIVGVIAPYIEHLEDFEWYVDYSNEEPTPASDAKQYISTFLQVTSDFKSFTPIKEEGHLYFGIADFIIARLYAMDSSREMPTADEIRSYAEKYLGVDGSTLKISSDNLYESDGRYGTYARGGRIISNEWLSEEVRDDVTVITVGFYADHSKTVQSCVVEYHLKLTDGEYSPVKTVIIEDSEFATENFYV